MAETMKLAVPTMGEGGLQAERSGHFGHCDCFTLIDIADGEIGEVSIIQNPPHEEGGCLRPVGLLSDAGANAIVAAGMGMRPLMGFENAGIDVLFDNVTPGAGADVPKIGSARRSGRVEPTRRRGARARALCPRDRFRGRARTCAR